MVDLDVPLVESSGYSNCLIRIVITVYVTVVIGVKCQIHCLNNYYNYIIIHSFNVLFTDYWGMFIGGLGGLIEENILFQELVTWASV